MRLALRATARLWVTSRTVMPAFSFSSRNRPITSRLVLESRFPVGSSPSRIDGIVHQGAGNGDSLLLSAGKLRRLMVEPVAEADQCGASRSPAGGDPPREFLGVKQGQLDVFEGRRPSQEVEILKHEADALVRMTARSSRDIVAISSPASL